MPRSKVRPPAVRIRLPGWIPAEADGIVHRTLTDLQAPLHFPAPGICNPNLSIAPSKPFCPSSPAKGGVERKDDSENQQTLARRQPDDARLHFRSPEKSPVRPP